MKKIAFLKTDIKIDLLDKYSPFKVLLISLTSAIFIKGKSYSYSKTLDQIESDLNPADFICANKQFIIARNSVKDITIWFDSRLLVTPDIEPPERIYVSKNKAAEFKAWIVNDI